MKNVSLPELEKVGRAWVAALVMMPGPCTDGEGLSTTNVTLSSLSLANTEIPSLASLWLFHHSSCEYVSHGLHIVAKC